METGSVNSNINPSISQSNFDYLCGLRIVAELKNLEGSAKRTLLFKSFLAVAVLAGSLALAILFTTSTTFLGTGLGLIILATFCLYHYRNRLTETLLVFKQAAQAITHLKQSPYTEIK